MKWNEIREHYPSQWLLVEAIQAHSDGDARIVDQLSVVDTVSDSQAGMHRYRELHRLSPDRELYVFHTDREALTIHERSWLGIRGLRNANTD